MAGEMLSFANSLIGYGMNKDYMSTQHEYNLQENEEAARLNFMHNERAADAADERARKFYMDINSPKAVREQLEEAGLSIGLMYGGAGGSGQGHASTQGAQGAGGGNQQGKTVTGDPGLVAEMALVGSEIEKNKSEANRNNADADATNTYRKQLAEVQTINWQIRNAKDEATLGADVWKAWGTILNMQADTQVKQMQALEIYTSAINNLCEINLTQQKAELLIKQAKYYDEAAENFGLSREQEKELREKGFDVEILKNNGKLGLALWYGKKYLDLFDMDEKGHALGKPQNGPTTGVRDKNGTLTGYGIGQMAGMK